MILKPQSELTESEKTYIRKLKRVSEGKLKRYPVLWLDSDYSSLLDELILLEGSYPAAIRKLLKNFWQMEA